MGIRLAAEWQHTSCQNQANHGVSNVPLWMNWLPILTNLSAGGVPIDVSLGEFLNAKA